MENPDSNNVNWMEKLLGSSLTRYDQVQEKFLEYPTAKSLRVFNNNNNNGDFDGDDRSWKSSCSLVTGLYFTPLASRECAGKFLNEDITAELIELYGRINKNRPDERLQIVQICVQNNVQAVDKEDSANNSKKQFEELLIKVPWFALPYRSYERRVRLRCRYNVRHDEFALVLLDATSGEIINKRGHAKLLQDCTGIEFPWYQPPIFEILKNVSTYIYCNKNNDSESGGSSKCFDDIDKRSLFGIYFSANWCPPCKAFTNQLIKTYKIISERAVKLEIIFVSSDRSEESYNQYKSNMPWLAVPYEDVTSRKQLTDYYGVKGIPTLVILDSDGSLITEDGRGEVNDDPYAENFPWYPKLVNILTDRLAAKLHNHPALVLFIDGEEEGEIELAETVLYPISDYAKKKYDQVSLQFFIAVDSESSENLRDYIQLEDVTPLVTIIDIPLSRFAVMEYGKDITEQTIMDFVNSFLQEQLTFLQIRKPK